MSYERNRRTCGRAAFSVSPERNTLCYEILMGEGLGYDEYCMVIGMDAHAACADVLVEK